jgi:SHS family lactate transporter-like MFS transporter
MPFGLDRRLSRVLGLTGLAVLLTGFDGSVLFLALPAISTEFHARVPALATVGSILQFGVLGALPLAALADRTGRRRLLAVGVTAAAMANLASGLAPSLTWLTVARMAAVCFETLSVSVATALVVEEVPPDARGRGVAWLTVVGGAGIALTVLSYPLLAPHWRLLYLAGGAGLAAGPLIWVALPESRAWSAIQDSGRALRLLLTRPWRRRLLVLAAASALGAALYEPAGLFVAFFGSALGMTPAAISIVVVVAGVASLPAFVLGARLSDAFGRRLPEVALAGLAAVGAGATFSGSLTAYWVGNVTWSILASASVPILGAWTGELFPTRARASSETVGAVAAAAGGAVGLQLVGLLSARLGLGHALALSSLLALIGTCLLLLLPETKGRPLPH